MRKDFEKLFRNFEKTFAHKNAIELVLGGSWTFLSQNSDEIPRCQCLRRKKRGEISSFSSFSQFLSFLHIFPKLALFLQGRRDLLQITRVGLIFICSKLFNKIMICL